MITREKTVRRGFGEVNWFQFELDRLRDDHSIEAALLERALGPVESALTAVQERVADLGEPADEAEQDSIQAILDDEADYVEDLLGVSFVIGQRYITQVVTRAKHLHATVLKTGQRLTCISDVDPKNQLPTRTGLMKACSDLIASTDVSCVQVVDAFANYFKHHEEWPATNWDAIKDTRIRKNALIVIAAGGRQGCTGNLRAGARALGNEQFTNLGTLVGTLATWRTELAKLHHDELARRGLIAL